MNVGQIKTIMTALIHCSAVPIFEGNNAIIETNLDQVIDKGLNLDEGRIAAF